MLRENTSENGWLCLVIPKNSESWKREWTTLPENSGRQDTLIFYIEVGQGENSRKISCGDSSENVEIEIDMKLPVTIHAEIQEFHIP